MNTLPKRSVLLITEFPENPEIQKTLQCYKDNNHKLEGNGVKCFEDAWLNDWDTVSVLIVDLDTYTGKDTDRVKEWLALKATRILLVCTRSFSRLTYYQDLGDCYTSYANLREREFFSC